ncbi:carboxylating nicotinate-nucleotide diphosphorylase [Desulfovibrio inopinatus]|uniref:carboxylating nicotinate-nucleotide diphosphorylase n=1 Tax=Desulfovibrio inopinatus TaxID=102109 RepID=UPI0003F83DB0|nr:carboxylating nicotinate-nucleotide diphosphorylase [Desulfovibrio inopinatus]
MKQPVSFDSFFQGKARHYLVTTIDLALEEDGRDLTSEAVFSPTDILDAKIIVKQNAVVAGLPILPIVIERMGATNDVTLELHVRDGDTVSDRTLIATMRGPAAVLLKAERVMLNFIAHLSGIATMTAEYVAAMGKTKTRLLDTRKTIPGLRYPEKYAVLMGGGSNHRLDLEKMFMLKDNHVDKAGGITPAVEALRQFCASAIFDGSSPPIEVECRTLDEVREAVSLRPERIMLDNMEPSVMKEALSLIPEGIETEISGGVSMDKLSELAALGADFISIGKITHSAPSTDFSMLIHTS